jgi:hypothetical protein
METNSDSEGSSQISAQILSPGFLKSLQVFYFAFGIGALLLLFFVLFQSVSVGDIPVAVDDGVARLLSLVHLAYGMAAYGVSPVVFRRILARGLSDGHADRFIAALRSAYILRLTIFEGVAYFGLVVLLISATDGVLMLFPQYWMNILSTLVLMVFIPTTFPTRERLQSLLERHAPAR